ncbi:MAG: TraR/DksA C4-type zinc finger protein [Burkholderiaceae bacterium]|nr:TraR/DksA C4-type zinc finger protein [Burkholderiaceae bacterium]
MDESKFELASELAERDRTDAIAAAHAAVERGGTPDCEDCDERISTQRRMAAPWVTRCLDCQEAHELAKSHYFNRFF